MTTIPTVPANPLTPFLVGNPGIADANALRVSVLTTIRAALGQAFGQVETAVPKMVGDELVFAEQYLQSHASGMPLEVIDGALAFGGTAISNGVKSLDTAAQAALVGLAHTVDAHLAVYAQA